MWILTDLAIISVPFAFTAIVGYAACASIKREQRQLTTNGSGVE